MFKRLLYHGPPWTELHEAYAKRRRIDDRAPVTSSSDIDIRADAAKVGQVIDAARLHSPVAVDSTGELITRGMRIHIKFAIVNPKRELAWTGRALWTKAVERLVLDQLSDDQRACICMSLSPALS